MNQARSIPLRWLILLGPAISVGALAAIYLRDVVRVLSAPGVPVGATFDTPGGKVRFLATSYNFDLKSGKLMLLDPELIGPTGPIASADIVFATGLYTTLTHDPVRVRVRGLKARLTRLPTGQLDLQKFLPKSDGEPSRIPFEVTLSESTVRFQDRGPVSTLPLTAVARQIQVSGTGEDWLAHADVSVVDAGVVRVTVQRQPTEDVTVRFRTGTLNLARAANHLAKNRRQNMTFSNLTGGVDGIAWIPSKGPPQLRITLSVGGKDARIEGEPIQSFQLAGLVTTTRFEGKALARNPGWQVQTEGRATWAREWQGEGRYALRADRQRSLPKRVRDLLPPDTDFQGAEASGRFAVRQPDDWSVSGVATATQAQSRDQAVQQVSSEFAANPKQASIRNLQAKYGKSRMTGGATVNLASKEIDGFIQVRALNLAPFAKEVAGTADLDATISGTLNDPVAAFIATGDPTVAIDGWAPQAASFRANGTITPSRMELDQALIQMGEAKLSATGSLSLADSQGALNIRGLDIPLSVATPEALGRVSVSGRITGSLKQPRFRGRVEGVNVGYRRQRLSAIAADLEADPSGLNVSDLRALRGTATLTGDLRYEYPKGKVTGKLSAQGIALSEFSSGEVIGLASIPEIRLGGSLGFPLLNAKITGQNWVARGVPIGRFDTRVRVLGDQVKVEGLEMEVAGGNLALGANFNIRTLSGHGSFEATGLALGKLATDVQPYAILDGVGRAKGTFGVSPDGVAVRAKAAFENIVANDVELGDADADVVLADNQAKVNLSVGRVLPELRLLESRLRYDLVSGWLSGDVDAVRIRGETIIAALGDNLARLDPEVKRLLESSKSEFTFSGQVGGTLDHLAINLPSFLADKLEVDQVAIGTLSGKHLTTIGGVVKVDELRLAGKGTATLSGYANDKGTVQARLTTEDFEPSSLGGLIGGLANETGKVNLELGVSGPTQQPGFAAKGRYVRPFSVNDPDGNARSVPLEVTIPRAFYLVGGGLDLQASATLDGFQTKLNLQAKTPLGTALEDAALTGRLELTKRSLTDIPLLAGRLEPTKTNGDVGGFVAIGGTAGKPQLTGQVDLNAPQLSPKLEPGGLIERLDTSLRNLVAKISIAPDRPIEMTASAESTQGGRMSFSLRSNDILTDWLQPSDPKMTLKNRGISGNLATSAFRVSQKFGGGSINGIADGSIQFGGTVTKPSVKGSVTLSEVSATPPALQERNSTPGDLAIDPTFDIAFALRGSARLKTTAAELELGGKGSVQGSLSQPKVAANFVAREGQIRLPGGLVRLERGGTVDFAYDGSGISLNAASLDVDLVGRTSVVASRFGEGTRRYDVRLAVQGDLINDSQLKFDAQSDPPDLGTTEVLAILGSADLIGGSGANAQRNTDSQLRGAIAGFALPTLLTPLTSGLAQGLGFEYLSVDYSGLDQTTVSFAKTLSRQFSIQGRRQVGAPLPGLPLVYDLRLVYSPTQLGRAFRRFNLIVGADQERPFKIALEYSGRFGRGLSRSFGPPTVLFPAVTDRLPKHQK